MNDEQVNNNTGVFTVNKVESTSSRDSSIIQEERSVYGKIIGKGEAAKVNIAFAMLRYLSIGAGVFIALIEILDVVLLMKGKETLFNLDGKTIINFINPLFIFIFGYLFGRPHE
jgi:hypothetical protein